MEKEYRKEPQDGEKSLEAEQDERHVGADLAEGGEPEGSSHHHKARIDD